MVMFLFFNYHANDQQYLFANTTKSYFNPRDDDKCSIDIDQQIDDYIESYHQLTKLIHKINPANLEECTKRAELFLNFFASRCLFTDTYPEPYLPTNTYKNIEHNMNGSVVNAAIHCNKRFQPEIINKSDKDFKQEIKDFMKDITKEDISGQSSTLLGNPRANANIFCCTFSQKHENKCAPLFIIKPQSLIYTLSPSVNEMVGRSGSMMQSVCGMLSYNTRDITFDLIMGMIL